MLQSELCSIHSSDGRVSGALQPEARALRQGADQHDACIPLLGGLARQHKSLAGCKGQEDALSCSVAATASAAYLQPREMRSGVRIRV